MRQKLIPLRAKQVSEANLCSEQGGINFTAEFEIKNFTAR
jgi:hypothetical protein